MLRNKDFNDRLQAWAARHDLRPSERLSCGHGVSGRGVKSEAHDDWCIGWRIDLLDHASLFVRNKTRLLVAFTFRPGPDDLGHESYLCRVEAYAERLGITAYMPPAVEPIHGLYARDTTAVLYGPKGVDLAPFAALPLGLSPDLDRRTAQLARDRESNRKQAARSAQARDANPKPLSGGARFRAEHGVHVRALYARGDVTQKQLAVQFGVSLERIQSVLRAESK